MSVTNLETKVARARRLLAKSDLVLTRQRGGYIVADHIGGVWGVPFEATIEQVLAFAEADADTRERMAEEHKAGDKLAHQFRHLRPFYKVPPKGRLRRN